MKIPLIRVDEIDSTSLYLARMLTQGEGKAPLAVIAGSQTKGKGRHGSSWISPKGNLYLSIGLAGSDVPSASLPFIPIYVGVLVAEWLESYFKFRITIKWPNDLLFGGAKLGGILVESLCSGENVVHIVLGIGINIDSYPADPKIPQATSLRAILGSQSDLKADTLGANLVSWIGEKWHSGDITTIIQDRFPAFSIAKGSLWLRDTDHCLLRDQGIAANGNLVLEELTQSGKTHSLDSINHGYGWIYAEKKGLEYPIVVADLGNSRFKLALYSKARQKETADIKFSGVYSADEYTCLGQLREHLDTLGLKTTWPIYTASVNPVGTDKLRKFAREAKFDIVEIAKRPVRIAFDRYDMSQIGIDRIALLEGVGMGLDAASNPFAIAISAGTAVTIDVIVNYQHFGGLILPGLSIKLKSLYENTQNLPKIDLNKYLGESSFNHSISAFVECPLADSTEKAMVLGSLSELVGAIKCIADWLKKSQNIEDNSISYHITGGWGRQLAAILDLEYRSDLILEGIRSMALGGILSTQPD